MALVRVMFCFYLLLLSLVYTSSSSSQSHHLPNVIRQLLPPQNGLPRDDLFIGVSKDSVVLNEGKEKYDAGVHHPSAITLDKEKYNGDARDRAERAADAIFFMKKKLAAGETFDVSFNSCLQKGVKFLAANISNSIPFSSKKFNNILSTFSIDANSTRANAINQTLSICDRQEPHLCATSLPEMIKYAVSTMGPNLSPISTEVMQEESSPQVYHLESEAKKVAAPSGVSACHILPYAYPVFYCHKMTPTSIFQVSLRGTLGAQVKALAICHEDTSKVEPQSHCILPIAHQAGVFTYLPLPDPRRHRMAGYVIVRTSCYCVSPLCAPHSITLWSLVIT